MLRFAAVLAIAGSASAFAPSGVLPRAQSRAVANSAPTMQLYKEGTLQGITVNAIPKSERPIGLDGTWVRSHAVRLGKFWNTCHLMRE